VVEQRTENPRVTSSTLVLGTSEFGAPRLALLALADSTNVPRYCLPRVSFSDTLIVLDCSDA
jgi:hypothetical protein